ncbi:TetR/AcrR family transcriptional regulator [Herpetosiphon llansteffanensis]|uniref:TetR/AcrR family transcriptional regulator n=1 Tax=Herpetosiphon llansteffanensis TaxID=2094568 RepID=UPI000D7CC562|nr:TetR/AcrR family transcriptional regulator [Herpetosiphon llansteffanensis]
MSPRRDVRVERTAQIIEAATRLFAQHGIDQTSMDMLAKAVGMSKGVLYWYFESKEAIILALLEHLFQQPLLAVQALIQAPTSTVERLTQLTTNLAANLEALQSLVPLAQELYALSARNSSVQSFLKSYFQRYRASLVTLIQQGLERGEFSSIDPEQVAWHLAALYEGSTILWLLEPTPQHLTKQLNAALQLLLKAIVVA